MVQPAKKRVSSPLFSELPLRSLARFVAIYSSLAIRPSDRPTAHHSFFPYVPLHELQLRPRPSCLPLPPYVPLTFTFARSLIYTLSLSLSLLYFLSSALSGLQNRSKVGLFISSSRTVPQLNICTYFNLNSADVFNRTSQDVKGRFSMVGKRKRRYLDGCGRIIAARTSKAEDQL